MPAIAQEPPAQERETRNEIAVFGGVSILDASGSTEWVFGRGSFPGLFPMFPGFPATIPDVTVRGETSLGSSALFGARYSRHLKDRLAVEADLAIAPTHDLDLGGEICLEGFGCFGEGLEDARRRGGELAERFGRSLGRRGITAWHYGGGLAYELADGDVRPFVLVGAGGVTWDGASDTDFVFRFGAGLKALFGNVGFRVDVTDHLVVDHFLTGKNEHDLHATAGFLVEF
ncbi:MAG TPA: hypothetical protein VIE88_03355 [Vicinamibacteria bacterium]